MLELLGVDVEWIFVCGTGGVDFLLSAVRISIPAIVFGVGHEQGLVEVVDLRIEFVCLNVLAQQGG